VKKKQSLKVYLEKWNLGGLKTRFWDIELECSFWREKWAQGPGYFYGFLKGGLCPASPPQDGDLLIEARFFDIELDEVEDVNDSSISRIAPSRFDESVEGEEFNESSVKSGSKVIGVYSLV